MTLGCARCGDCCEEIWSMPRCGLEKQGTDEAAFLLEHWQDIGDEEGHYTCDQFDRVHRLCLAHEDRPPVCSNYPWYSDPPGQGNVVIKNPQCSYLLDLPPTSRPEGSRPLIPVEVLRG